MNLKLPAEVKGLDAADWAGFTNFRTLVDSLKLEPLAVKWDAGVVLDPVRHAGPERNAGPSNGGAQAVNGFAANFTIHTREMPARWRLAWRVDRAIDLEAWRTAKGLVPLH
jgi:hypothetical protein